MPKVQMTATWLKALKAPNKGGSENPDHRTEYFDTGQRVPGVLLSLRVGPHRMTWVILYTLGGKRRRLNLGHYPVVPLERARELQLEAARRIVDGFDPGAARAARHRIPTFSTALVEFLDRCRSPRSDTDQRPRVRSWKSRAYYLGAHLVDGQWELRDRYLPVSWAHLRIDKIKPRDIRAVGTQTVEKRGDATGNRVHSDVSALFSWCVQKGWIDSNPARGIPLPGKRKVNKKILQWEELVAIWRAAEDIDSPTARIIQALILWGQRPPTTILASWEHIRVDDEGSRWWYVPDVELKAERKHVLYMGSALARRFFEKLPGSGYLFPWSMDGKPCPSTQMLRKTLKPIRERTTGIYWSPKLFRPTLATRVIEDLDVEPSDVSFTLHHSVPGAASVTMKHYAVQATYRSAVRRALEPYHDHLMRLLDG